eukprot:c27978_g1_i1.p1 GENE.c27978_g1_i1~~c27978_g1_i1.p1  ORF type:complete len:114 (+),score=13.79 c27978_g1_i1:57-398(+)
MSITFTAACKCNEQSRGNPTTFFCCKNKQTFPLIPQKMNFFLGAHVSGVHLLIQSFCSDTCFYCNKASSMLHIPRTLLPGVVFVVVVVVGLMIVVVLAVVFVVVVVVNDVVAI